MKNVHLFGIRHHGVGSARNLISALTELQPDCILIEGPPDADALIPFAADAAMQPPVALLVYNPDRPQRAAWYPFAVYSPEWQAMRYALENGVDVSFCDLPQRHMMALEAENEEGASPEKPENAAPPKIAFDPLQALAEAAGESDGERWWNRVVEEVAHPAEIFAVLHDAMASLRTGDNGEINVENRRETLREAWMRKTIRAASKKYQRVAVVCGAWHTPALADLSDAKADNALLKGLPGVKTVATFAPWTYSRIAMETGYGAGIVSPGWYHHLWETPSEDVPSRWLAQVAALLREEQMLASTAQVIDALRLTEMLAVLRGHTAGLEELNEASIAVLMGGHDEPLALIRRKLIISERMGSVAPDVPDVPLQRDIAALQKSLRLKISPETIQLDLDLRKPNDLARSRFFHRLNLLGIPWAKLARGDVSSKGTFHEFWDTQWTPELDIRIIETNIWGTTLETAAVNYTAHVCSESKSMARLTKLLNAVMLAELPDAVQIVLKRLEDLASLSHDIGELMGSVPPLVDTLRYSDVRQTDATLVAPILENVLLRICIGLYPASLQLDDEAAQTLYTLINATHSALTLAQRPDLLERWYEALAELTESEMTHAVLAGTASRLLLRGNQMNAEAAAVLMSRAFTVGNDPHYGAFWLEGFLSGMEHTLLHDETLFGLVDSWVTGLDGEHFEAALPLVRRTFGTYTAPTRRNISDRIKRGARVIETDVLDEARAARVLPVMRQILGITG